MIAIYFHDDSINNLFSINHYHQLKSKKRITFPPTCALQIWVSFDYHKIAHEKSTNLCFFVNNKDTTETIFFGKSWWRRAFELMNLFFGLIVYFLCARCFFPLSDIWCVTFWDVCTLTFPFHSSLNCLRKKIGILATNSIICKTNSPTIKN